ncbi:MAG: rane or secreted protein [Sphingobacteriales bacterium]|nr:rane or secreted protein [Sphingobacteriales bacterium]
MKRITGLVLFLSIIFIYTGYSQTSQKAVTDQVFVDKEGVMRWKKTGKEANFFGVNYTVPFAYGYRSHKALGVDLEKAIDQDVYHFSRLGLDAFRVHVWDAEISDKEGNLINNEHLRLFDYLIAQLEKRNIKILITPIAFWGNGYPEKDEKTGSFSNVYGKGPSVVKEEAFVAQERYIAQLLKHKNPYTKLTYVNDANIIAMEINNEPHHSGPKARTTEYVNRMAKATRSTGWTKPVFYNISESPWYSDAVVKADVDGHSFQWYPTGLVANHTLQGNFLPNVDKYVIPFDSIPAFKNRAKMVYEFDAGDVLQSYMYPAMARSFRSAGFQWATQFAYDPIATAYANTEYQTHYLNLAYTPSKAISLLIASKAFHQLPRSKSYGTYPVDTLFNAFRVSYRQSLSEMNAAREFYYSNTTQTKPVNISTLAKIAGVGSSPIVKYSGYGAYFLDKLDDGIWRLEVMPDAIHIRDPFAKASPKKEVTRIQWLDQSMQISLPNLGYDFEIKGLNDGNSFKSTSSTNGFNIKPGTYLLVKKGKNSSKWKATSKFGSITLNEFVAPKSVNADPFIVHQPYSEVTAGKAYTLNLKATGVNEADKLSIELHNSANKWKTVDVLRKSAYDYQVEVPAELVVAGVLNYKIVVRKADGTWIAFPDAVKGNPTDWDYINEGEYKTFVATANSPIELFNTNVDRSKVDIYAPDWTNFSTTQVTGEKSGQLLLRTSINNSQAGKEMAWQFYFADKVKGRKADLLTRDKLMLSARSDNGPIRVKISLITNEAQVYSAYVTVNKKLSEIEIPIKSLIKDNLLLLPRPYPGFQTLNLTTVEAPHLDLNEIERLGISFTADQSETTSIEVESILLQ